jgi:hypothetical protein
LVAVACGDEPGDGVDIGALPDPARQHWPTAIRLVDGPPADELAERRDPDVSPEYLVTALGTDEVLVGSFSEQQPLAFFVGTVDGGDWEAVDLPPIDGEIDPQMTTVGQDAVLVGAPCPGDLNPESDEYAECPDGYEGLGLWRFGHEDHEWHEVTVVPEAELDLSGSDTDTEPDERWWWDIIGTVDGAVAVNVVDATNRVVLVDLAGEVEIPYRWDTFASPDRAQATCITGTGVLVGTGGDGEGLSGGGVSVRNLGYTHLAVHEPDAEGWTVLDTTVTDLQSVGCGADQITVVGETDETQVTGEWRTLNVRGRTIDVQPLPRLAVLGAEADMTTVAFFTRHQYLPNVGRNRQTVVRDLGDLEQIDRVDIEGDPGDGYPVLLPRRITVLPGPGGEPLIQSFVEDRRVAVKGTTAMPDGTVVALVMTSTEWDADDEAFQLLVAA